MAYIAPNSTVRLLENCPLPYSKEHTLYWSSATAQTNYFTGLTAHTLSNYSYVRPQRALKVAVPTDDLFEVNYMMFQNTAYGSKWFYAFVTDVQYINDNTSLISFEIDAIQTFFFEMELKPCWIERQHSTTDVAGDNLVPENIDTGYMVCNEVAVLASSDMMTLKIMIAVSADISSDNEAVPTDGGIYAGSFSGIKYYFFDHSVSGASSAVSFLETYENAGAASSVIGIALVPQICVPDDWNTVGENRTLALVQPYTPTSRTVTLDGYTPKNNKLFTYPYNYLEITNSLGSYFNMPWEFFGDLTEGYITFYLVASTTLNPEIICYPHTEFRGIPNNQSYQLAISGFPQCAWSSDPYLAYLAQTASRQLIGFAQGVGQVAYGAITALTPFAASGASSLMSMSSATSGWTLAENALQFAQQGQAISSGLSGVYSGLMSIANQIATLQDMARMPPTTHGTESNYAMAIDGRLVFVKRCMSVNAQVARTIDDFFTMYGYAQHIVATPNIHARSQFTYIKTTGAKVGGSMPAQYETAIEACFDRGITFWTTPANMCDYSVSNTII